MVKKNFKKMKEDALDPNHKLITSLVCCMSSQMELS